MTPAQESFPVWSPDGRAILFWDQASNVALVSRREPGGRWSAARPVASPAVFPEWSPDGREVAYLAPTPGAEALQLLVMPAEGGRARRVFDPGPTIPPAERAQWSRYGRTLYYKTHDAQGRASFWVVNAAGGRPRLLVRFNDPGWQSNRSDFATDGKRFYFTIEDRQSDVFVAELIRN